MKAKEFAEKIGGAIAEGIKEGLDQKPCGFEEKPCTRKCIHYNTCTRNPYRYGRKERSHDIG